MDNENTEFCNVKLYRYTATSKDGNVEHGVVYGTSFEQVEAFLFAEYLAKNEYRDIDVYTVIEL